jgi:hypothetical protein
VEPPRWHGYASASPAAPLSEGWYGAAEALAAARVPERQWVPVVGHFAENRF